MTYRFLGSLTIIHGDATSRMKLNKFGQAFELPDERAADALHPKGIAAIPEADFLAIWPDGKADPKAPDFQTKKMAALARLDSLRKYPEAHAEHLHQQPPASVQVPTAQKTEAK